MAALSEEADVVMDAPRAGAHGGAGGGAGDGAFAPRGVTMRDVLTAVFYDRWAILTAFLVPLCLGVAAAALVRTTYEAEARLLVLLGREYMFRPETGEAIPGFAFDREQIVKAELEILGSRELKAEVIKTIGLDEIYPGATLLPTAEPEPAPGAPPRRTRAIDLAIERFEKELKLSAVQGSNVIQLAYSHRNAQIAAEALNLLVRYYIDKRREVFSQTRSGVLVQQRDQYAKQLADTELKLQDFRTRNSISNIEEQTNLLLRQEYDLNTALQQLDERIRGLQAQGQGLKAQIAQTPAQVTLSQDTTRTRSLESARATLMGLELRRRDLLTKYKESSRMVADVDAQIAEARRFLAEDQPTASDSTRVGRNPVVDDLERDLARLEAELQGQRARKGELDLSLKKLRERLSGLTAQDRQFRDLERERSILEENYRTYTTKLEEARITEEFDRNKSANIRIIQSAEPPAVGKSLRLPIVAASMFLGLLSALATAFVVAQMRQIFLTPDDVERGLGLPVLLVVPLRQGAGRPARAGRRSWK
jgi:succinoglycan biosynthesis transport protein ExoP